MKILMSVQSNSDNAQVDPRFGRCSYFALVNTETNETTFIKNNSQESGSGINAANTVLKVQPDAVIVGNIGPKAFQVLDKAGLKVYEGLSENISKTLELFNTGQLKQIRSANK